MSSTVDELLAEALFASSVQPSEAPTPEVVRAAIAQTISRYGRVGCAARVATEFGDHPDVAVRRMAWVRRTVGTGEPPAPILNQRRAA
jgi:hypothetical protein